MYVHKHIAQTENGRQNDVMMVCGTAKQKVEKVKEERRGERAVLGC